MTDKELWELRLSLIKDVMTLTDKQVQYIIEQNNDHHKRRTGIAGYAAQGNAGEKKPYADYADCWGTSGRDYRV